MKGGKPSWLTYYDQKVHKLDLSYYQIKAYKYQSYLIGHFIYLLLIGNIIFKYQQIDIQYRHEGNKG